MDAETIRVDLHVHSRHSSRPSQWLLQKINCPESFTDPLKLYAVAGARGMDLVTITDHNTIAGSLEIAHLPGTFVSEEITTYFPEDRCKLHVLVYHITEAQHSDIQKARENVFDLVPFLRGEGIVHVLAHPLFSINQRLTPEHFEKCLLLFNTFEINGTRDAAQNEVLQKVLDGLTRSDIERLADMHGIEPLGEAPWIKGFTGGSDDHSGLNIARMYTELPALSGVEATLAAVARGQGTPVGTPATPLTMAHNIYGIAYQFYRNKLRLPAGLASNPCLRFADHALDPGTSHHENLFHRLCGLINRTKASVYFRCTEPVHAPGHLLREAKRLIEDDPELRAVAAGQVTDMTELERQWTRFTGKATDKVLSLMADKTLKSVLGANIFDVFHTLGSAGSLYAILAPYFVGYGLFASERTFSDRCLQTFGHKPLHPRQKGLRVAHFTDTLCELNGVAHTLRQQLLQVDKHNKRMRVLTCGQQDSGLKNALDFDPVGTFKVPEYPELTLAYPPFLKMLAHCHEEDYDLILAATPGPMGLAALAMARILKKPFHGTYHTAFPQYVSALTGDPSLEEMAWRYMLWFYRQMDVVYSPSEATATELADRGIDRHRIRTYPRGVDTTHFHPAKRNGFFKRYGLGPGLRLLYVGRVSREKDLPVLCDAFISLSQSRPAVDLVVVGDGPYLKEMRARLQGCPVTFTGTLQGEELAEAYASADIFVFPSTTDTFDNVVLEAQASGLPVIVADKGGPKENMLSGQTGLVIPAGDAAALARAVLSLADCPQQLEAMRRAARAYVKDRTFDATFLRTWEMFSDSVVREAA